MAAKALETLPEILRQYCRNLIIRVEEFPDEETRRMMEIDSPFDLLGLYHGVPLNKKSSMAAVTEPDMIFLYRSPILNYWYENEEDLNHLVRHVLIHEIGHHFGFSDEEMATLEASTRGA